MIRKRWQGPAGCGEVLRIALPLIISTGAHTVQMFVDSVFLMRSSRDEMSAAAFAGVVAWLTSSLFQGIVTYTNTFVAQYSGAGRLRRVGRAVWQGVYFAVASGASLLVFWPLAGRIFAWAGHDPILQAHEVTYYRIMLVAAVPMLVGAALSTFFTGRRKTLTVMWVHLGATAVNIVLDYGLIFGRWGLPRWGVRGAAWATVAGATVAMLAFAVLFLRRGHRRRYGTLRGWRFDGDLMWRLVRFGGPSGVHFFLDIAAFTVFQTFMGRLGPEIFAAVNMTFRINLLAFLPMIGAGIAVSTLVGHALGAEAPGLARRATWSGAYIVFVYMFVVAVGYWFKPDWFLAPFAYGAEEGFATEVAPLARSLLMFVAFYSLFDGGNIVFSATLKGAGDTRFVMVWSVMISWVVMVAPTWLVVTYGLGPGDGLYLAWVFLTGAVCLMAGLFLVRFLGGKWQEMRVIERPGPRAPTVVPAVPAAEVET